MYFIFHDPTSDYVFTTHCPYVLTAGHRFFSAADMSAWWEAEK